VRKPGRQPRRRQPAVVFPAAAEAAEAVEPLRLPAMQAVMAPAQEEVRRLARFPSATLSSCRRRVRVPRLRGMQQLRLCDRDGRSSLCAGGWSTGGRCCVRAPASPLSCPSGSSYACCRVGCGCDGGR
jgi:hypothetical protein